MDRLTIAAVERKGNVNFLAVETFYFECVRTPARVGMKRHDFAGALVILANTRGFWQRKAINLHNPINALPIDGGFAFGLQNAVDERRYPLVSVGRSFIDDGSDNWQIDLVFLLFVEGHGQYLCFLVDGRS